MSGGSGTGCPVMNKGLRCAQTGRSERKRAMEEAPNTGENKSILLFQGRRGGFFFPFFFSCRCKVLLGLSCGFSVELHHLLRTRQLGASGALGSRSVFCQLSVMKKEKQLRREDTTNLENVKSPEMEGLRGRTTTTLVRQ